MRGPDIITIIISGLIKPLILLLIMFVLFLLLRRQSAALKHFCLLMGMFALLILPVSAFIIPDMSWEFPFSYVLFENLPFAWQEFLLKTSNTPIEPIWWQGVLIVYLLGSTSIIFYLLIGYWQVWNIFRHSQLILDQETLDIVNEVCQLFCISGKIRVVFSKQITSPCVWGIFTPVMLLPSNYINWTYEQKISVIMHELGHIHRHDSLSLLIVKITCAIFWFLIPVWWFSRKMNQHAEIACDDLIYRLRDKQVQYAEHLLQLADHSKKNSSLVMPMSGHSEIYQRIMAVLDSQKPRQEVRVESTQYPVLIGIILVLILGALDNIHFNSASRFGIDSASTFKWTWGKVHTQETSSQEFEEAEKTLSRVEEFEMTSRPTLDSNKLPEIEKMKAEPEIEPLDKNSQKNELMENAYENVQVTSKGSVLYKQLHAQQPKYPATALKNNISGFVKIKFNLTEDGVPTDFQILESQPTGVFDAAVVQSLKNSRFATGDKSAAATLTQDFTFEIDTRRKRR